MNFKSLALGFVVLAQCHLVGAMFIKRTSDIDFDDPRMFTSAFGKRSGDDLPIYVSNPAYEKRFDDFEDPRFMTSAFGKRSVLPISMNNLHRYAIFEKRSADIEDPRFFSGAFGRRK